MSAADALLHRLWTKAVGTPDYDKDEWHKMEALVRKAIKGCGEEALGKAMGAAMWPKEEDHPASAPDTEVAAHVPVVSVTVEGELIIFGATDERPLGSLAVNAGAIQCIERTWGHDANVASHRKQQAGSDDALPPLIITMRNTAAYRVECAEPALLRAVEQAHDTRRRISGEICTWTED